MNHHPRVIWREWCDDDVWEPCPVFTVNGNPCRAKAICYRPVLEYR